MKRLLFVFIVICYLSLVIFNLIFEGAKMQKMLTSVLAEGAKTWRVGRCTLHEGRWVTDMLPNDIQKEPKGPKMEPRGAKREPRGAKWEPKGYQHRPQNPPTLGSAC